METTPSAAGDGDRGPAAGLTSQFLRYPTTRQQWLWDKSTVPWLKDKRAADGVGDLWRVHDQLYDLTAFAAHHPGGRFWIETTRGQDVTELFETSHCLMTGVPERLLERYRVGPAAGPRNAPYTFHEDGFYRTLRRRAAPVLRRVGTGPGWRTTLIADGCFGVFAAASAAAALLDSRPLALLAGAALMLAIGTGHNFLHQRDNWRMFYLDLSFLSSAEWRVSHALSHHMFPNTAFDLEVTQLEPLVRFLTEAKSRLRRGLGHLVLYHVPIAIAFYVEGVKRLLRWLRGEQRPRPENFLPLLHLLLLAAGALLAGRPAAAALPLWALTHSCASYLFLAVGFAAAHHHPSLFHDGDVALASRDWGLQQLDAVSDRTAVRGSLLLVLTTFGDHGLHHMFPTVDHAKLAHLHGVFDEVCAEFGVRYHYFSQWEMLSGQYRQMERTEPRESELMATRAESRGIELSSRG